MKIQALLLSFNIHIEAFWPFSDFRLFRPQKLIFCTGRLENKENTLSTLLLAFFYQSKFSPKSKNLKIDHPNTVYMLFAAGWYRKYCCCLLL
jgi:hypothetical protein